MHLLDGLAAQIFDMDEKNGKKLEAELGSNTFFAKVNVVDEG